MTTLLTLVILAVLWAAVLLPGYLRNRTTRQSDSVMSFRRLVTTLERTGPEPRLRLPGQPPAPDRRHQPDPDARPPPRR